LTTPGRRNRGGDDWEAHCPALDDELFIVIHLMIAGRLRWRAPKEKLGFGGRMLAVVHLSARHAVSTEAS
jgi:hypothetical protein